LIAAFSDIRHTPVRLRQAAPGGHSRTCPGALDRTLEGHLALLAKREAVSGVTAETREPGSSRDAADEAQLQCPAVLECADRPPDYALVRAEDLNVPPEVERPLERFADAVLR